MPLHRKIIIGLLLGGVAGALVRLSGFGESVAWSAGVLPLLEFVGALFIRLITMIVVPLVAASLLIGIASLGDIRRLGRIGGKTLLFYLCTTAAAVTIGLLLATTVRPGSRISPDTRATLAAEFGTQAQANVERAEQADGVYDVLLRIVPSNPLSAAAEGNLLPLIVFVVIFGAALSLIREQRRNAVLDVAHGVNDAVGLIIDWVMRLAPYAVFALLAVVTSRFGADLLRSLVIYMGVVVAGLLLHMFGVYSTLVAVLARRSPRAFFRSVREAQLIAFSTSSSNATLPVTMETAEEKLLISRPVSSFVLPLGATMNMDGTALYQGVATVFIAQVYGFDLGFAELATIVLTATLASVGAAGVPSAGIITLILVLESVGMGSQAAAGIALILGVDRILDMLRTATNITGDLTCAAFVDRTEARPTIVAPEIPTAVTA